METRATLPAMEYFAFSKAAPKPCLTCNKTEILELQEEYAKGKEDFWIYRIPAFHKCKRCDKFHARKRWREYAGTICAGLCEPPISMIDIPIKLETVGVVERAIHSSSIGEKGSDLRSHGTFISHLTGLQEPELYKQALCAWAPTAMMAFMENKPGVSRKIRKANLKSPPPQSASETKEDSSTAPLPSATLKSEDHGFILPANLDSPGVMEGTQLKGDEYDDGNGPETRIKGDAILIDKKILATQIGPDIIPTEVMDGTIGNMKAALKKRVQPLPFQADKTMVRKIEKTVRALMDKVFSRKRIAEWREKNPDFDEMKSSKWSAERWRHAWDEALSEPNPKIEQTFQIKINEALPAKDKAPRAIIQCGDRAQVLMKLPVRCFEELLFEYFESASIKHLPKYDAMKRVADHLRQPGAHLIEGDGSAWDACCNPTIRSMTENRILEHIIAVLGDDKDIPKEWFNTMLADMKKEKLKGKVKVRGWASNPIKVCIDAIRQSGHAGTSCFNWLINFVCWLCVMAEDPWKMVGMRRTSKGLKLNDLYTSVRDGKQYHLKYAFEGDDSALSTTEDLAGNEEKIEKVWSSLGFRMKLVFVTKKLTFTGFDFLCNEMGPTGIFIPEIARNIASSSWSTSSELKMNPKKLHQVGAAAMLARAENFKDVGPYARYFAALGLAHARQIEDFGLEQADALRLGIQVSPSVKEDLQVRYDSAMVMNKGVRALVDIVAPFGSVERELQMLNCDFGLDPFDCRLARELVPKTVWDPAKFSSPRR